MSHISKITSTENVTLVTFDSVPANISFLEKIFCAFADRGINVDMISKATPTREYASLSFTTGDNQLTEVLAMTNEIRSRYPTLKPIVSSSNVKLSLYGEDFQKYTGIAAVSYTHLDVYKRQVWRRRCDQALLQFIMAFY